MAVSRYAHRAHSPTVTHSLILTLWTKRTDAQLVITGDFFQLPPVTKGSKVPFFAFESPAWKACIERTVVLQTVYRQKDAGRSIAPSLTLVLAD